MLYKSFTKIFWICTYIRNTVHRKIKNAHRLKKTKKIAKV